MEHASPCSSSISNVANVLTPDNSDHAESGGFDGDACISCADAPIADADIHDTGLQESGRQRQSGISVHDGEHQLPWKDGRPGHSFTLGKENGNFNASWHKYIRGPSEKVLYPAAVLDTFTRGNVVGAETLLSSARNSSANSMVMYRSPDLDAGEDDVPSIVFDFGQNLPGVLQIEFGESSTLDEGYPGLKLIFSETLQYLGNRSDFTRSDHGSGDSKLVNGSDQIAVKPQPNTWRDQLGCEFGNQVCCDGLHGFRYLKIQLDALPEDAPYSQPYGHVEITSLSVEYSGFHGTPETYTGWFECSDEDLTQWWYDGSYTNEVCTDLFRASDVEPRSAAGPSTTLINKIVIHDGAKRDRDPYVGDLAVSALTAYLTHEIPQAVRNVLVDLAVNQREDGWIPPASINNYTLPLFDYPLWWVVCSWDLVYYAGDIEYLEIFYPSLQKVLNRYYPQYLDDSTGLLVRPKGYGDYAFTQRTGISAYYNALYALALKRAADLADYISEPKQAAEWRKAADQVAEGFRHQFWDPATGAFFDRKCAEAHCEAHAQDGNSLAILAGIVPPSSTQAQSILKYMATAMYQPYGNTFFDAGGEMLGQGYSTRVYAFLSYFELAARFVSGESRSALDQIRRMYGWMAAHDPGITQWEGIGENGSLYEGGFTSAAHGWSTGIVPLLTNYVLGIRPTKPGFREWVFESMVGRGVDGDDITWARGQVSTLWGLIEASWWRADAQVPGHSQDQKGSEYIVQVVSPPQTMGQVVVSQKPETSLITVNGQAVWEDGQILGLENTDISSVDMLENDSLGLQVIGGKEYRIVVTQVEDSY